MFCDDVEVVAQRQVLVDDLDPQAAESFGPLIETGSPSQRISPSSIGWMPAIALIRVDLPAPLSPTSAMTSPCEHVEVDSCQRLHRAEALADAAQLE